MQKTVTTMSERMTAMLIAERERARSAGDEVAAAIVDDLLDMRRALAVIRDLTARAGRGDRAARAAYVVAATMLDPLGRPG